METTEENYTLLTQIDVPEMAEYLCFFQFIKEKVFNFFS